MRLEGTQIIAADRATVWAALNDPEVLKACIPGCQSFDSTGENSFETVVKQKVGPVSATFKGLVDLVDVNPPNSYRIVGEGKGGAAGFAKGEADVSLADVEGGTELTYGVEVKIGGKIAQLGSRLIDGFAKKLSEQFFACFKEQVEGPQVEEAPAGEVVAGEAPEAAPSEAAPIETVVVETTVVEAMVIETAAAPQAQAAAQPQAEPAPEAKPEKKSFWKKLFG